MSSGGPHGQVFVTDFGLAKATATGSKFTRSGETLGTPAYMSPEQARGELADLSPASDTWACGTVLYEMLSAGRPAFDGPSPAAVVAAVLTAEPLPLPGVPRPVTQLIDVTLEKGAAVRPANAGALAAECRRVLGGQAPSGARRGRRLEVVAALVGIAAVAVGLALRPADGPAKTRPAQVPTSTADARAKTDAAWQRRLTDPVAARAQLAAIVQEHPGFEEASIRLGLLCWTLGKRDEAEHAWGRVPPNGPNASRVLWLRGLVAFCAHIESGEMIEKQNAYALWRKIRPDAEPHGRWAQAGLAGVEMDHAAAADGLEGETHWQAQIVRILSLDHVGGTPPEVLREGYTRILDTGLPLGWAYVNRALAADGMEDYAAAAADYDRAERLMGANATLCSNRAASLRKSGDNDGALAELDRAVQLDPTHTPALVNRGRVWIDRRNWEAAERDLDRALALDPSLLLALAFRAEMWIERGDLDAAAADVEQALSLDPHHRASRLARSTIRRLRGDLPGALADLSHLIDREPDNTIALNNRGILRHQAGDLSGAERDLRKAIELRPDGLSAMCSLGNLLTSTQRYAEALAVYDRANAVDPNHYIVRFGRGATCMNMGRFAEAADDFDRALEIGPDSPELRLAIGQVRHRLQDWQAAAAHLRRYEELADPNDPRRGVSRRLIAECEARGR